MSGFLMVCNGFAAGQPGAPVGQFLESCDVDAHGGRGAASWTSDPSRALRFVSAAAALACWKEQSRVLPLRPDGKPNRPLAAFTITVTSAEAAGA